MEFRPCIDIHNGQVKQIVGASLRDQGDQAQENYVADQDAAYFAKLYQKDGLKGGHVILLNGMDSSYYQATRAQAMEALEAYPGGLQVGGGITPDNAGGFLDAGASHVIVTSYVFREGKISYENLEKLSRAVGRQHLVLDISCRRRGDSYYVVTDRWQRFTQQEVTQELLDTLASYADEFLVHGVDVEGQAGGIEATLAQQLSCWSPIPITYAGGVSNQKDLERLWQLSQGRINVTIGSALDLFGGKLEYHRVLELMRSWAKEAPVTCS